LPVQSETINAYIWYKLCHITLTALPHYLAE